MCLRLALLNPPRDESNAANNSGTVRVLFIVWVTIWLFASLHLPTSLLPPQLKKLDGTDHLQLMEGETSFCLYISSKFSWRTSNFTPSLAIWTRTWASNYKKKNKPLLAQGKQHLRAAWQLNGKLEFKFFSGLGFLNLLILLAGLHRHRIKIEKHSFSLHSRNKLAILFIKFYAIRESLEYSAKIFLRQDNF